MKYQAHIFCFKFHKIKLANIFICFSISFYSSWQLWKHNPLFYSRFVSKHERSYYLVDHYSVSTVISEMRIIQKALNERWQYVYRVEIKHYVEKQYGLFWYFFRVYSFINKWKFYFSSREEFYFPDALHKAFGFSVGISYHVGVTVSYKGKNMYLRYESSPRVCNIQHNPFNWKDLIFMITNS